MEPEPRGPPRRAAWLPLQQWALGEQRALLCGGPPPPPTPRSEDPEQGTRGLSEDRTSDCDTSEPSQLFCCDSPGPVVMAQL